MRRILAYLEEVNLLGVNKRDCKGKIEQTLTTSVCLVGPNLSAVDGLTNR